MKKLLCYLLFFSCTMLQLNAQISAGGTPVSFLYPNVSLNQPEALKMPAFDLEALRAEDFDNDRKGDKPYRFGYEMEVSLNEQNAGVIDYLPNGDKLWRVALKSTDALTINLIFNRFVLPEGAQLFIYNKDHSEIIGAFTEFNNQSDGKLGTTLVSGDEIIVEYYEPSWVDFHGEVEIGTVIHGYRSIAQVLDEVEQRAFGSSGSCNINVNCASGASWATEKRSVGMMVSGGGFCTGALLNNTNNNGTPYFMSANHCYSSGYSTWVYWFNWEAAGCTNPASSPAYNSVSGLPLKPGMLHLTSCCCNSIQLHLLPTMCIMPVGTGQEQHQPVEQVSIIPVEILRKSALIIIPLPTLPGAVPLPIRTGMSSGIVASLNQVLPVRPYLIRTGVL
jgi:lysyl endopeptidase